MSPTQNPILDAPADLASDQPPSSGGQALGGQSSGRRHRIRQVVTGTALLSAFVLSVLLLGLGLLGALLLAVPFLASFEVLVLRQPLRSLLARDTAGFARGWVGRVSVGLILIAIPLAMVVSSVAGSRYGRYADDSWKALLMLGGLTASYLIWRRLLLSVLVATVTVATASWVMSPNLATDTNGDAAVLAHLHQQRGWGNVSGYRDVAVAEVDLNAAQPVRLAGMGADDTTVMEVGSMTKAMTGLVIADAVTRGEIRMDAPVGTYLPQLNGSPAGTATIHELVTHTAGYSEFGDATLRRAAWKAPLGQNFFTADHAQMTAETRKESLNGRGSFAYSTLGSATAGQAVAAAAHMSYPDLMRTRLFEPLGMSHTAIQINRALVPGGHSQTGLPVQPWVMDAYAPGAAAVSTIGDLAKLATALLEGTAPGMAALEATTATDLGNTRIGGFWKVTTWGGTGQTITHHAGQTGGYASYLGLDRAGHKAVIVLSDIANDASDLGSQLLANRE